MEGRKRFSVVIPTYQRRDVVVGSVGSLAHQTFGGTFEVVVVVDGSDDGSAEALRDLQMPFPLTVLVQPNQGAAAARNHGAARSEGEVLLFLDDDMEADSVLLAEHDRSHREGADAVLGHLPLHPQSPPGFLSAGTKSWAEERLARLSAPGATLTLHDMLTGQMSISREVFQHVAGFDTNFTHGGAFGNEDVDFGCRLLEEGYRVVFNPRAISWQRYVVRPRQYLRQWHQAGRADVVFARKHSKQAQALFGLNGANTPKVRFFWRPLQRCPPLARFLSTLLETVALAFLDRGKENRFATRLFRAAVAAGYWRGVHQAGGMPRHRTARVLAYHAIADLDDPVLAPYGVPPAMFASQLDALLQAGYRFVAVDEFLRFLAGQGGLPRRALLLTFDDCYLELADIALPILVERSIPAVAFAVSGQIGGFNEWDRTIGAPKLRLLGIDGLQTLAKNKIEIGAHSRTHRLLPTLRAEEIEDEVAGSLRELHDNGIKRPRVFAYPYGESDSRVRQAARDAGLQAAFSVRPGFARSTQDPYQIPRIEILRGDTGWKLRLKVGTAGQLSLVSEFIRAQPHRLRRFLKERLLHND